MSQRMQPAVLSVVANPTVEPVDGTFITALGDRLRRAVRWSDVLLPQGPDRYALLCNAVRDEAAALQIAERLEAVLEQPLQVGSRRYVLRGSIGLALRADGTERPVDLLEVADVARRRSAGWVADALVKAGSGPAGAALVLRDGGPGSDDLMRLPGLRLVDAVALGEEMRADRPGLGTAAARLDSDGDPWLVSSGVERCA